MLPLRAILSLPAGTRCHNYSRLLEHTHLLRRVVRSVCENWSTDYDDENSMKQTFCEHFSMQLPDGFDYRLTESEEAAITPLIPSTQSKVHLKFRCYASLHGKLYDNCLAILCEHTVTICGKGMLGKSLKVLKQIHMFEVEQFHVIKDNTLRVLTESDEVYIYTTIGVKFGRFFLRNAILAMPLLPQKLRFEFTTHDPAKFPPFEPSLSATQNFQFQYNASCCFRNSPYVHEVTQYFHSLVKSGDGIFDLNAVSPFIVDSVNVEPILYTLMHTKTFCGIHCDGIHMPNIVKAVGSVVEHSKNLNVIKLVRCGATEGCEDIMGALDENKHHKIVYWDLSGNILRDIDYLLEGFARTKTHIYSIMLEDCKMSDESVALLFGALESNHRLHGIRQLAIAGNRISTRCGELFSNALAVMSARHRHLEMLSFGPVSVPEEITTALDASKQPLKHLRIVDVNLSHSSVFDITRIVSTSTTLEKMELINCTIDNDDLHNILKGVTKNGNITKFSLALNKMKVKKNRFAVLLKAVEKGLGDKLVSLSLEQNGIGRTELNSFVALKDSFKVLKELSIAGNLSDRPGTGDIIANIMDFPKLTHLNINGHRIASLKSESQPVIAKLATNSTITHFDIGYNGIDESGIVQLLDLLKTDKSLKVLEFDGNAITNVDHIRTYLEICRTSPAITKVCVPRADSRSMLALMSKDAAERTACQLGHNFMKASHNVMLNCVKDNVLNNLSMTDDPVLHSVIDMITVNVQHQFEHKPNVGVHCSIAAVVGLPMPFEPAGPAATLKMNTDPNEDDTENVYTLPLWMSPVKESLTESENTVLYGSLCGRRPSFSREDRMYAEVIGESEDGEEEEEEFAEEENVTEDDN